MPTLAEGTQLGPYRILSVIGAGGMGEVYKALDTRLDRTVAIKISHAGFSERFEREAKVISSLNHPHICALYDVGQQDGIHFLVMEFIEGQPLRGPLPADKLLTYASQIAGALGAAHRKGVTHRDLKPGNILVNANGVKLLDFGLAKITHAASPNDATLTQPLTQQGSIMGTYHYMAPEQYEGKEADARSDIWAFGCVLHEMATGKRAFHGETQASLIGNIMHVHPAPVSQIQHASPPSLDRIIRRCLAKDPEDSWQSARDILLELHDPAVDTAPGPSNSPQRAAPWIAAGLLAVALAALAFVHFRGNQSGAAPSPVRRFKLLPPTQAGIAAISPDGKHIAYESGDLWIHDLDQDAPRKIAGASAPTCISWSPDSQWVSFASGKTLQKVQVTGQPVTDLAEIGSCDWGSTWSPDGRSIVVATGNGERLFEVPSRGGTPKLLIEPSAGERGMIIFNPSFLPVLDHRILTFSIGQLFERRLAVQDLDTGKRIVLRRGFNPIYSATGHLIYSTSMDGEEIWALPFDLDSLAATGEPFRVVQRAGPPSIALDGTLVYSDFYLSARRLVWRDRSGKIVAESGQIQGDLQYPSLSPDGSVIAARGLEKGIRESDIWLHRTASAAKTRLSTNEGHDSRPIWTPDGKQIAYALSGPDGGYDIVLQNVSGTEPPVPITTTKLVEVPNHWSPDGQYLMYHVLHPKNGPDLWLLKRKSGGGFESAPFLQTPFSESEAQFSPDGRFVAYESDESGRFEIYLRNFPTGDRKWKITHDGGTDPRWRKDGKDLFYVSGNRLTAVAMTLSPEPATGAVTPLFSDPELPSPRYHHYDVSPDGQRFVLPQRATGGEQPPSAIRIVQNWFSEFAAPHQ
ncbi:MAG: serine/threonine-protein kinase [Acidobacteriia bacterium]|nr:serine/threonine-protein kinase [Terriglobia bacterium]